MEQEEEKVAIPQILPQLQLFLAPSEYFAATIQKQQIVLLLHLQHCLPLSLDQIQMQLYPNEPISESLHCYNCS